MIYFGRITSPWIELFILFSVITIILFIIEIRKGITETIGHKRSFNLSSIASLAPIVHLFMGLWLLTISHCHPTHQFSYLCKTLGLNGWSIWVDFWLFSLFWHGVSFLLVLISLFFSFRLLKESNYITYQIVIVVLLFISFFSLVSNFPDA